MLPTALGGAVLGGALLPRPAQAAGTTWNLTGNTGVTVPANFLGTIDNKPLALRTNNLERVRVTGGGNVGIGTAAPTTRLHVVGAGLFQRTSTTGSDAALTATTASRESGATALYGSVTDPSPGSSSAAVRGANAGTGTAGIGVWGSQAGSGYGLYGTAGKNGYGLVATAAGSGYGVLAINTSAGTGGGAKVQGGALGLLATAAVAAGTAIQAENVSTPGVVGRAVVGLSASGTRDRIHPVGGFYDAAAEFCGPNGVIGAASTDAVGGYGVIGLADNTSGVGVYASGLGGASAILALGDVDVLGTLTKSGGSFRIDHPLHPADRYLSHSFVESPDMKNIYDGVATADAGGRAVVTLPDWFSALNRDLRYQLTPLGASAPELHVAELVTGGRFTIAGARAGQQVSWQVTGIRQDAWAQAHRIPVEHDKPAGERGSYLHPELHGAPDDQQVGAVQPRVARTATTHPEVVLQR